MTPHTLFLATFLSFFVFGQSATYENVTIILTTLRTAYFVNDTPPKVSVFVRQDNNLAEYFNNQPLEIIGIKNQNIPVLAEKSVYKMPKLVDISIVSSNVKKIQPGAFQDLPFLEYIRLNDNLLEEIPDGVFVGLETLNTLYLENNKIAKLGDKVFNNIPLRHLFIGNNRLPTLRSEWFEGSYVESISMEYNAVEELPGHVFDYKQNYSEPIKKIWYLVLNNNGLKKIDPDAFEGLEQVGFLNLANNSLEELPNGVFRTIKYMNNVDLSNNLINIIEDELLETKFSYLNLENNRLRCFPTELKHTDIYQLKVDGNPLTCDCMKKLKKEKFEVESVEKMWEKNKCSDKEI